MQLNNSIFALITGFLLVIESSKSHAQSNIKQDDLSFKSTMKIEPLFPSQNFNECLGIAMDEANKVIYFATNGKYIYKYAMDKQSPPELITTIKEVMNPWNDDYGDTFLHEMKLGKDGFLYAAAENCVIQINTVDGTYAKIISEAYRGPWGAYGLELDQKGNIYVGDHHGGIHVYLKQKNWAKKTIITATSDGATDKSFGGIKIENNQLCYLDFENSLLVSASMIWKGDFPEIQKTTSLKLTVPYPEYMETWKGDIFVKAARENTLLRIRNNKVIQRFDLIGDNEVSPIVTFVLKEINDNKCELYGMSWGPNATMHRGEVKWLKP